MDQMVSICGLRCDQCGAYIATTTNDDSKREETAKAWSEQFHVDIKPKDVNCLGCLSDAEPLFSHCKVCEIRKCGKEKKVVNCAHCGSYACDKLEAFFKMAPMCKTTLDEIHLTL